MHHPYAWLRSIAIATIFLLCCVVLGLYIQSVTLTLLGGVTVLLALHYWRLYRLNNWLWHSKKMSPPKSRGIWSQIYQGIYGVNVKNRDKRKNLGEVIRFYRQGSEALPDAALIVDSAADIVWCNRLARIELGIRWPDDKGKKIYDCIDDVRFVEFFHSNRFDQPIEIISPVNLNKVFEFRIVPFEDDQLMILVRDVTRLSQIEKMRKDFVANVSHELRTPLTVINGYLEMLPEQGDLPAPVMNKAITEMRTQSSRMQSLIEELLVLSRIEASTERVFEKLVNVPQLLWQIHREAEALNRDRQHKIFFDISPVLHLYGIESELRSAFSNIIFNAIHYTPNNGVIEVNWSMQGEQAKFCVRDNGDGIASKEQNRIFEKFYRISSGNVHDVKGYGIGLYYARTIVEKHDGKLDLISKEGNTTFKITLPS